MQAFFLEMLMDRRHQEDTPAFTVFFLGVFEIAYLDDDGDGLHEINAAEDGNQQFLSDDDTQYGDDTTQTQTAGVTHEYLRGEAVPPVETDAGSNQGSDEDYQFADVGDVHDVQIIGENAVARQIGENGYANSDDRRCPCCQAVQPVGEIGTVGDCRDDENDDENVYQRRQNARFVTYPVGEPGVVKLVVFDKWNGGFGGVLSRTVAESGGGAVHIVHFEHFSLSVLFSLMTTSGWKHITKPTMRPKIICPMSFFFPERPSLFFLNTLI